MSKPGGKDLSIFNSPIIITIVGFLLTGILGGTLTNYWHSKEFSSKAKLEREYAKIVAHSEAWKKLYNNIFGQTASYVVASRRVVSLYENTILNYEQKKEILSEFNSISNQWQMESIIIRSQLPLLFFEKGSNEELSRVVRDWDSLILDSRTLYQAIEELVKKYHVEDKSTELTRKYQQCKKLSDDFESIVYNFGSKLIVSIFQE